MSKCDGITLEWDDDVGDYSLKGLIDDWRLKGLGHGWSAAYLVHLAVRRAFPLRLSFYDVERENVANRRSIFRGGFLILSIALVPTTYDDFFLSFSFVPMSSFYSLTLN